MRAEIGDTVVVDPQQRRRDMLGNRSIEGEAIPVDGCGALMHADKSTRRVYAGALYPRLVAASLGSPVDRGAGEHEIVQQPPLRIRHSHEISPLTMKASLRCRRERVHPPVDGIRFVAAFWVFAYHLQGPFNVLGLLSIPVMGDVMRVGRLGVDLFFALSGFILTHTYLTRMGSSIRGSATLSLLVLRLAGSTPCTW